MKEITRYDEYHRLVYTRNYRGDEAWYECGHKVHELYHLIDYEAWHEYDDDWNEIHFYNSSGLEIWWDSDGRLLKTHFQNGEVVRHVPDADDIINNR